MRTGRDNNGSDTTADAAQVHVLFREVNERIRGLNASFDAILPIGEWVCECADAACIERLHMTFAEYEAIRDHASRFAVVPGHELSGERVVERRPGYLVLEPPAPANGKGDAARVGRAAARRERTPLP